MPNIIVYKLIGVSAKFTYYEQTIRVNRFTTVTVTSSIQYNVGRNSYFKIGFIFPNLIFPSLSFPMFDINLRAKELGIKISGIVKDGEVYISSSFSKISIIVNVFQCSYEYCSSRGSIIINIDDIPDPRPRLREKERRHEWNEDENLVLEAIGKGALALGGFLLFKVVKAGIGAIMGGPVGAAIGFAC